MLKYSKPKTEPLVKYADDPTKQCCPKNQSFDTDPGQPNAVVILSDIETTDNSGQNQTVTCSVESGSQFKIGEIVVVIDSTENRATCVFTVKIEDELFTLNLNMKF